MTLIALFFFRALLGSSPDCFALHAFLICNCSQSLFFYSSNCEHAEREPYILSFMSRPALYVAEDLL